MARPLSVPESQRGGSNGRPSSTEINLTELAADPARRTKSRPDVVHDQHQGEERLRAENAELRALCYELEQALQEASQPNSGDGTAQLREYESMLEEKTETIRNLHQQLQETQAALAEVETQASQAIESVQSGQAPQRPAGPVPREEELLALSEELERERRQLQEDEQTLMEQMREMECGMAKERAEMARQRNDLQRLQGEIRHELERLEKSGAIQSKIEGLKNKLQDATTRRGAAHGAVVHPSAVPVNQAATQAADGAQQAPAKKDSLMGRLFGSKK
jgi:chromosome segregation ATPase